MNMFFNFGDEWCTFDKQKDAQNLKALWTIIFLVFYEHQKTFKT